MPRSLVKSTGIVGAMTLVSRILGFVRDMLIASFFGAGAGVDAFLVAWRIPNLGRRMFAEGAFSQAFVPVFTEARSQRTLEEQRHLVSVVSGTLSGVLLLVTIVGTAAAPLLMMLFAPGFGWGTPKHDLGVHMLHLTFPYLLLISLTALMSGVLNSYGKFAIPAATAVLLNICMIAAIFIDSKTVEVLAWSVLVAGVLQLAFQAPSMARLGLLPRPRWAWHDPEVRHIIKLMLPILFGSSIGQISLLLDTVLASFLANGSVSWIYFADRVMEFPLGMFSIALATVILPSLATHHAKRSATAFSDTLDWSLRSLLVVGLPAMVALAVLAGPLVSTLFGHARFDNHDVRMTQWALIGFALGFMGFSLVRVLIPAFYARQETRIPVRYGVIALSVGMVMSVVLVGVMLLTGFAAPHMGLALSTSINAWVNAGLLFRRLRRDRVYRPRKGWGAFGWRLLAANLAMGIVIAWMAGGLAGWLYVPTLDRVAHLLEIVVAGAVVYFGTLWLCGMRLSHFKSPAAAVDGPV
ncbi:MAG TPA: murein biosynthesis integral membrane protein MurJ [Nevskiaceae bacterium]|nr:murein biosynthesis integral membrane protein MurJ [Nevskiaceae bacterium]